MKEKKLEGANPSNLQILGSENTTPNSCTELLDTPITFGCGPLDMKGPLKALIILGIGTFCISGLYYSITKKTDCKNKIKENDAKSANKVHEHHEASKDRMAEDDNRTDNKIRYEQAKAVIRREERAERTLTRQVSLSTPPLPSTTKESLGSAIRAIHNKVGQMSDCSAIPFLDTLMEGCPEGYEDAMLLSLLSALGALCFSKVRAVYEENEIHAPNLQTIIEGAHGSGKGKIKQMYKTLFSRIIEDDAAKLKLGEEERPIIQTAGINITASKYFDIADANKGVHTYAMETEIQTVVDRFKKKGGLSYDFLRLAFDNDPIYQSCKTSGAATGSFPVFFNYTFTGTPKAVAKLITPDEVEGGTAVRICFSAIPEIGKNIPSLLLPEGDELEAMRDQIDVWRENYCFHTINGSDIPCNETIIDLSYINDALKTWLGKQYDLAQSEGCDTRNAERARMATIAFHAAIVLHMLAGNPGPEDKQKRRTVKKLTLYIADICMERYLQKFTTMGAQADVNVISNTLDEGTDRAQKIQLTPEQDEMCYNLKESLDEDGNEMSWGAAAKRMGLDRDTFRNAYNRHVKRLRRHVA